MSYELEGKVHKVFPTEQKTDSFQAREFVVELNSGSFTNFIKFQLVQDRCAIVDNVNEGDMIKVYFDLRGREWNGKYFTNLNAWKVDTLAPSNNTAPPAQENVPLPEEPASTGTDEGDLPF